MYWCSEDAKIYIHTMTDTSLVGEGSPSLKKAQTKLLHARGSASLKLSQRNALELAREALTCL